jgi:hypothetical protein
MKNIEHDVEKLLFDFAVRFVISLDPNKQPEFIRLLNSFFISCKNQTNVGEFQI